MNQGFWDGCAAAVVSLETKVKLLQEMREDMIGADPPADGEPITLTLHPRIAAAALPTFHDEHYREAVHAGAVALILYVRERSGVAPPIDGADLMRRVFSRDKPILAVNALADEWDRGEQEGAMHLFEGAAMAVRNPPAHKLTPLTREVAVERLGLLSHLARWVESAKRV